MIHTNRKEAIIIDGSRRKKEMEIMIVLVMKDRLQQQILISDRLIVTVDKDSDRQAVAEEVKRDRQEGYVNSFILCRSDEHCTAAAYTPRTNTQTQADQEDKGPNSHHSTPRHPATLPSQDPDPNVSEDMTLRMITFIMHTGIFSFIFLQSVCSICFLCILEYLFFH